MFTGDSGLWWSTITWSLTANESLVQKTFFLVKYVWSYKPSMWPWWQHMTLQPTVMHHHTKFCQKRLSSLEDILWKKMAEWTDRWTWWFQYTPTPTLTLLKLKPQKTQCACVCVHMGLCVHTDQSYMFQFTVVCVCLFFHTILCVNCFGRAVLYMLLNIIFRFICIMWIIRVLMSTW